MAPSGQKLSAAIYPAVKALPEIEKCFIWLYSLVSYKQGKINIFKQKLWLASHNKMEALTYH